MKKYLLILIFASTPVSSQSLDCQIMREQILKESRGESDCDRQFKNQNNNSIHNHDLSAIHYQACKQGELIGKGLVAGINAANGQPATLQDRINFYKQKCE